MIRKLAYLALAAMLALAVACKEDNSSSGGKSSSGGGDDSPVLAVVNGEGITLNDFKVEASKLNPAAVQLLADENNRQMLLDKMINRRLLVQAGNEKGLDRDPRVLAHLNRVRDDKVMSLYMKEEVFDKSDVTDQEAREYFDQNKASLGQVRLSHILVTSPETAEEVYLKLKNGDSFRTLASKYSQAAETKNKGGDLGFISWAELSRSPKLRDEAFSLEPGSIGSPVYTPDGYHILKITDRKPASDKDYEALREPLKEYLGEKKAEKLFEAEVEGLKTKASIKKNDASINELSFLNLAELAAPSESD